MRPSRVTLQGKGENEAATAWVKPNPVGEIKVTEWTTGGEMRHPALGKKAGGCRDGERGAPLINIGLGEEVSMAIVLNHTSVPACDKEAVARFFAQIFGLPYKGTDEHLYLRC
jgi:hypothetical protein